MTKSSTPPAVITGLAAGIVVGCVVMLSVAAAPPIHTRSDQPGEKLNAVSAPAQTASVVTPVTEGSSSAASASSDASRALVGIWRNERGSELRIESVADGHLQGAFRSAVGRVDRGTLYPIVGVIRGDVVGFSVDFGAAGSVASWAGQVEHKNGTARLVTQWHLVRDVPDDEEPERLWSSTLSGADVFVRQAP